MPAAFPVLTTTSRVARTDVLAGAIRVSRATGWPSAMIEIQEVWVARITTVNLEGALDLGVDDCGFPAGRFIPEMFAVAGRCVVAAASTCGAFAGLADKAKPSVAAPAAVPAGAAMVLDDPACAA